MKKRRRTKCDYFKLMPAVLLVNESSKVLVGFGGMVLLTCY